MPSFLKPVCPHCHGVVEILGKGWQAQRATPKKVCPLCCAPVKLTQSGKTFVAWMIPIVALGVLAIYAGFLNLGAVILVNAIFIPVFASGQLEKDTP